MRTLLALTALLIIAAGLAALATMPPSGYARALTPPPPPPTITPVNPAPILTVRLVGPTKATLGWRFPPRTHARGWMSIDRSDDGGLTWCNVASGLPLAPNLWTDSGLQPDTPYCWRCMVCGTSPYTNVAGATTFAE